MSDRVRELSEAARVELSELSQLAQVLEADARRAWGELARAAAAARDTGATVQVIAEAAGLAPTTMRKLLHGVIPTLREQPDGQPG
jgi:hypothetical protein